MAIAPETATMAAAAAKAMDLVLMKISLGARTDYPADQ
jgi:hypothetical protein